MVMKMKINSSKFKKVKEKVKSSKFSELGNENFQKLKKFSIFNSLVDYYFRHDSKAFMELGQTLIGKFSTK